MAVQLCCTERYPDSQYQSGVALSPLAAQLVRTPEFQRLRHLKQLGLSHYTFPTANHTRFEHSLGVAHWARELAQHLAQRQPELGITAADLQTLEVAGLLHDLGHGPFSHVFETEILPRVLGPDHGWEHEAMSLKLVERVVARHNATTPDSSLRVSDQMLEDIKDIISGNRSSPRFQDRPWMLQIVANPFNGVDVDRADYLPRDARNTAHHAEWNFDQLKTSCQVVDGHIAWQPAALPVVWQLFASRFQLHQQVYQHPATKATEALVADALVAADLVLNLRERCDNIDAFLATDDYQLLATVRSITAGQAAEHPCLAAAQQLLARLDRSQPYQLVGELPVPEQWVTKAAWDGQKQQQQQGGPLVWVPGKKAAATAQELVACWSHNSSSSGVRLQPEDLWVSCVKCDYGSGEENPMDKVEVVGGRWPAFRADCNVQQFLYRFVRVYIKRLFDSPAEAEQYIAAVQSAFRSWGVKHFEVDNVTMQPAGDLAPAVVRQQLWLAGEATARAGVADATAGSSRGGGNKRSLAEPIHLCSLQLCTPEKEEEGAPGHVVGPATSKRQKGLFMASLPAAAAAAAAAAGSSGEVVADSCSPLVMEGRCYSPLPLGGALSATPAGGAWAAAGAKAGEAAAVAAAAAAAAEEDVIEDDDDDDMLLSQQESTMVVHTSQFQVRLCP